MTQPFRLLFLSPLKLVLPLEDSLTNLQLNHATTRGCLDFKLSGHLRGASTFFLKPATPKGPKVKTISSTILAQCCLTAVFEWGTGISNMVRRLEALTLLETK